METSRAKSCQGCGNNFSMPKLSARDFLAKKFCSDECLAAAVSNRIRKQTKTRLESNRHLSLVVSEYEAGKTLSEIGAIIGKSRHAVKTLLVFSNAFNANRERRQKTKGKSNPLTGRRRKPIDFDKIYCDEFVNETKAALKYDEQYWWDDVIERKRIVSNKRSLARYHKSKSNSAFRIMRLLRTRVYATLKNQSASSYGSLTHQMLGCNKAELLAWFQNRFQLGMTWNNMGKVWHIDHIRPCVSFDLSDENQQLACFHYTNLQPLFAQENWKKQGWWNGINHRKKREPYFSKTVS